MRFFIGQPQPQREITVWLRGPGELREVTRCHGPASTIPCTFWVAFEAGCAPAERESRQMTLEFREAGTDAVLGEIGLRWHRRIPAGPVEIGVFEARSAANRCQRALQSYAYNLRLLWLQNRSRAKIRPSLLEHVTMSVLFTCPRPISLVTLDSPGLANIFPLNVMSDVTEDYFAFALTACKLPAQMLERARRFALSSTPIEHAPVAFALAAHHNRGSVEWKTLPFRTRSSTSFGIPVPEFSPRIREMCIESVHRVGSHSLFVARTLTDEGAASGPEFSVVHGVYQAWRIRRGLDSPNSVGRDAWIRSGTLDGSPAEAGRAPVPSTACGEAGATPHAPGRSS